MAAAAILKNPTKPEVVFRGQTVLDNFMSIDCIRVEYEVGYCDFVHTVSAIFLLPVSAYTLIGRRLSHFLQYLAPDVASLDRDGRV